MSFTICKHNFLDLNSNIPTVELLCNKKILAEHFEQIDMEFEKGKRYCISKELYETIECRLTKPHETFLNMLSRSNRFENKILPLDYKFKKDQLDNIIYIAIYYHQCLYDLWAHPYNKNISKDFKLTKKDYEKAKIFLEKVSGFNIMSKAKHYIHIRIVPYSLQIESYIITEALLDFLRRIIKPEKYVKQIKYDNKITKLIEIIGFNIEKYGDTGQGKNYEVELTQKFTWLLFKFIKKKKMISPLQNKNYEEVPDRIYYSFISDLYSLVTLVIPNKEVEKEKRLVEWSFFSEDYDKIDQIKRIESWIYNYNNKLKRSENV